MLFVYSREMQEMQVDELLVMMIMIMIMINLMMMMMMMMMTMTMLMLTTNLPPNTSTTYATASKSRQFDFQFWQNPSPNLALRFARNAFTTWCRLYHLLMKLAKSSVVARAGLLHYPRKPVDKKKLSRQHSQLFIFRVCPQFCQVDTNDLRKTALDWFTALRKSPHEEN